MQGQVEYEHITVQPFSVPDRSHIVIDKNGYYFGYIDTHHTYHSQAVNYSVEVLREIAEFLNRPKDGFVRVYTEHGEFDVPDMLDMPDEKDVQGAVDIYKSLGVVPTAQKLSKLQQRLNKAYGSVERKAGVDCDAPSFSYAGTKPIGKTVASEYGRVIVELSDEGVDYVQSLADKGVVASEMEDIDEEW